ncbi:hypothetical protein M9H77_18639 [Catharanthus roseus]|uniref:Uncharacterized protein n=1 Tax=Catharanthus roseus TaxID=4058 RepID=A0ACC0B816_CATRO|nr:hypothetical protein M9H77_18639 [Catharanthus roseus]
MSDSHSSSQIFQISLLTKQTNRLLLCFSLSNPVYLKTPNLYLKTLSQDSFNMVKTKNANVGKEGHGEVGGSSRGGKKGKGKQVARSETPLDKFISVQAIANYEDWTQKKRKIAPGHRVNLSNMRSMEIISALFHDIDWGCLLIVSKSFYPMMLYEFYANLQRGRTQSGGNVITSRVNGKNIVFDDKLLNSILETPEDGMCFYTKNKKFFDPNLYSEKRFEEIFTKGIVLKRSEGRTVAKLNAYGRILHHIISNIVIPSEGHKSSITNMHSFVMLEMHEHRKMNFSYIAIDHMLATQSSSTKCLPYVITLALVRFTIRIHSREWGGHQGSNDDEEDNADEEEGNELESMDEKDTNEEDIQREMRSKKRQERMEEGQSSVDTAQIMDGIATMQAQLNDRLDDLNDKIVDIQNLVMRLERGGKDTDEDEDD